MFAYTLFEFCDPELSVYGEEKNHWRRMGSRNSSPLAERLRTEVPIPRTATVKRTKDRPHYFLATLSASSSLRSLQTADSLLGSGLPFGGRASLEKCLEVVQGSFTVVLRFVKDS